MRRAAVALAVLLAAGGAQAAERRCGWLHNPTPGNWWLTDRVGQWVLSTQGGYEAGGMESLPDMTVGGWVATNGSYGYGCACLRVEVEGAGSRIVRVLRAEPLPLSRCRNDRSLPRP
ncbi:DUF4087 domain-containing protein [Muricoccus radiodurans]|uniref:DUF4087 domain-containing protein n=1 Tax=Muricoccus radiodurans TaxID=2231721 RepID=UPI003CF964AD